MAEYRNVETGEVLSEEQFNSLKSESEKFDRPVAAGLQAAARGASFGLSDVLQTSLGIQSPEELAKLKEYNPAASMAGEITGVVAPALLTGGAGLLGTAARGVAAPVRGVTALGKLAENSALKLFGETAAQSTAKTILKNAAAKGFGSAVEGAFYGAGQVLSEAALGDPKEAAEKAFATIGLSSLLSGSLVGGLNVAGGALKTVGKSMKGQLPAFREFLTGVGKEAEDVIMNKMDKLDELASYGDDIDSAISGKLKGVADEAFTNKKAMFTSNSQQIDEILKTQNLQNSTSPVRPILDLINETKRKLAPSGKPIFEGGRQMMSGIDQIERDLITYAKETSRLSPEDLLKISPDDLKVTGVQLNQLRAALNDEAIFAKDIGKSDAVDILYERLGTQVRKQLDDIAPEIRKLNKSMSESFNLQKELKNYGLNDRFNIDVDKLKNLVGSNKWPDVKPKIERLDELWNTNIAESIEVARAAKKIFPKDIVSGFGTGRATLPGMIGAGVGGLIGGPVGAGAGVLAGTVAASPVFRQMRVRAVNAAEDMLSGKLASKLKELGGNSGTFIPDNMIPFVSGQVSALANIERANKSIANKIDRNIGQVFEDNEDEYSAPTLNTLQKTNFGKGQVRPAKDRMEAFKKRSQELTEIANDPDRMSTLIGQNTQELAMIAPQIAAELTNKAVQATNMLYQALPKPMVADALRPDKNDYEPSDHELARFERITDTIENPMRVLEDLKHGTLTNDQVQVLKNLYPTVYQQIALAVHNRVMKMPKINFNQRMKLVPLLGSSILPKVANVPHLQQPQQANSRLDPAKIRQSRETQVESVLRR